MEDVFDKVCLMALIVSLLCNLIFMTKIISLESLLKLKAEVLDRLVHLSERQNEEIVKLMDVTNRNSEDLLNLDRKIQIIDGIFSQSLNRRDEPNTHNANSMKSLKKAFTLPVQSVEINERS